MPEPVLKRRVIVTETEEYEQPGVDADNDPEADDCAPDDEEAVDDLGEDE